jgi:hypothetical protein
MATVGPVDLPTVLKALHTLVEYVDALERRVQTLQITTGAIAAKVAPGEHLRDEDVKLDVIRPGDRLRVSTTILQEWIDNAGLVTAVPVLVKEVRVEDDGTKTLVVGPR